MRPNRNMLFFTRSTARNLALTLGLFSGCGVLDSGGDIWLNEPLPSGTQVATGAFPNGGQAQGTVRVIETSSGSYVVRLESFNTTASLPLMVTATIGGQVGALTAPLRATSGNQNYTYFGAHGASWSSVEIRPAGDVRITTPVATAILFQ